MAISNGMLAVAAKQMVDSLMKSGYLFESVDIESDLAEKIKNNVIGHAAACAVASMAAGLIPGAGGLVAMGLSAGALWAMFIKICKLCKISIRKNMLKTISSAMITDLAVSAASLVAVEVLASFVPGAGVVVAGLVNFFVVYAGGLLFLKLLGLFFTRLNRNPEDVNEEEMRKVIKDLTEEEDLRGIFKEAKDTFKSMRKDGTLDKVAKGFDIQSNEEEDEND